jgi:preprotein translocase subunit SecD
MAYMVMTYGSFAVFACSALIINVLLILGIMGLLNATLTLPGLAGMVLTIGAAVDANVLINERIREELRRGRTIPDALRYGFAEASTAIFDANFTNTIAGVLMLAFGSGPIRGFAIVLIIGIVTSYFTGVTLARLFVSQWYRLRRPRELYL